MLAGLAAMCVAIAVCEHMESPLKGGRMIDGRGGGAEVRMVAGLLSLPANSQLPDARCAASWGS